ncbi:MAG TPA: hypothetical protein VNY51_01440 [Candidatus Dormibacteraeota bacterium]|nr:hypothetical protein [Candidatus Dormibacteraeota bacterium]
MPYVDALTSWDIDFGRKLWQALRQNKVFPAQGVFWLLDSENGWRLSVATSRVDEVGRRQAYEELGNLTRGIVPGSSHPLLVELVSPRTPLYQALRLVFAKTASVEGARLGNTQVGGMFIDDAYLYEIR